ncbi:hypothetical protein [Thermogutta sp.]|uniref:hypothetical protein n=1 Tax=Thermogutta sp. TaxID=1962930 RepID=UPI0032202F59
MANRWSTWDVVLWLILGFVGVNLLLQVMLRFRAAWISRLQEDIHRAQNPAEGNAHSTETNESPSAGQARRS